MQMQHTRPHGPYPALLAGMHVVTIPLRSVKSSSRHLPAGQARKRVSKAVQRLGAADLQAPKQPGPSTIQAAGMIERSADAQQKYSDAPERLSSSALLRRLTAVSTANEALDIFLQDGAAMQCSDALQGFTEASPVSVHLFYCELLSHMLRIRVPDAWHPPTRHDPLYGCILP